MVFRDGISCIIINYKSLDSLKICLISLRKQIGIESEIIVVDNNSNDGSGEFLENANVKFNVLRKNIGFGSAVNIGAKEAEFKYLFVLNPDTQLPEDTLKKLFEFAEKKMDFGLLAPVLEYPDGRKQLSARSLPGRRDFFLGRGSPLHKLGLTGEKEAGYIHPENPNPIQVPAVSATAILVRKELFENLGGFDQRFFMYLEDIDLCRRVNGKGLPIILIPAIRIYHSWKRSSSKRPYFASFHHHLSVWKYFNKYNKKQIVRNLFLLLALIVGFLFNVIVTITKRTAGK